MNRSLALGCLAIAGFLTLVAVASMLFGPKLGSLGVSTVKRAWAEEERVSAFEAQWKRPTHSLQPSWFPTSVAAWELKGAPVPVAGLPEFDIQEKGLAGSYSSGGQTVKVLVFSPCNVGADELFANLSEPSGDSITYRFTRLGNRATVTRKGTPRTFFWLIQDSLFVFQTDGPTDLQPFAEAWLPAMRKPVSPPKPGTREPIDP